jgi:hypothetical protein
MRVNIYAEELSGKVELIKKTVEGQDFTAVRFWLYLPVTVGRHHDPADPPTQVVGPFIHRPGDDDSSAVTFWGKRELIPMLEKALDLLKSHYGVDVNEG